jgi:hypothetical protein
VDHSAKDMTKVFLFITVLLIWIYLLEIIRTFQDTPTKLKLFGHWKLTIENWGCYVECNYSHEEIW